MRNYYESLEVNEKASKEIIEKAYKVLVKRYHPDLYVGQRKLDAEKKIREINEAYDVLSNAFLREQYDSELAKEKMEMYNNMYKKNTTMNQQENRKSSNEQANQGTKENLNIDSIETKIKQEIDDFNKRMSNHKVGSYSGLITLCKEIFKNRPKIKRKKEINKKDILALILTVIVILIIGTILWCIPFTNSWIRELLFENPIFNWISRIFG